MAIQDAAEKSSKEGPTSSIATRPPSPNKQHSYKLLEESGLARALIALEGLAVTRDKLNLFVVFGTS